MIGGEKGVEGHGERAMGRSRLVRLSPVVGPMHMRRCWVDLHLGYTPILAT
jgi:hypothetical protein